MEKDALLGDAYAYLFPIDWPEPFGLTMIEAMATGTPVIALDRGSVPEVVRDGVTGFICKNVDEMVWALEKVPYLDRWACQEWMEQRFSARAMTEGYESVYLQALETGASFSPKGSDPATWLSPRKTSMLSVSDS